MLDLVITLKHPCHSKGAFLHKQEKNICTSQPRLFPKPCFLDNVAVWGNRQLPPHGASPEVFAEPKMIKLQGRVFSCLHYESDFLPHCLRRQLLTVFPSGVRNEGIINPLDLPVQERWSLPQQVVQPAALCPWRGQDPEVLSASEVCWNSFIWGISRSQE